MSEDNHSTEDVFLEKHFRYVRSIFPHLTFFKDDITRKIISLERHFSEVMNDHGNDPQMNQTENHGEGNRDIQYHVHLIIMTSMSEDNRSTEDVFLVKHFRDSLKNREISEEHETHNVAGSAQKETENYGEGNRDIQYHVHLTIMTSMSEDNRSTEDVFLVKYFSWKDNISRKTFQRNLAILTSMSEDNRSTENVSLEKHFRYVRSIFPHLTFSKDDITRKIISLERHFSEVMNEHGNDPQMDRCVERIIFKNDLGDPRN
ncbi:hypothetical protein H5410_039295, partial [Solanum commersonii]